MRWMLFTLLVFPLLVTAQTDSPTLELDADLTAEELVRDVFASGNCETIFNIQPIGSNPDGIGFFSGPSNIVGFDRGIILSTGDIRDAAGPNSATNISTQLQGRQDDPDLSLASTGNIFDPSGIEFDFIPLQPTVTFRYVFASEEYCEFVNDPFNDIFGFFISGPGINGPFSNGAINLALVPGTNQPVSINNVNFSRNASFYLDNESPSVRDVAGCGGNSEPGPRFATIEYDGQTVILTATINLQTCATYHIRLVVGDVQDPDLDSAVFLEAGSFDLGGSVSLEGESPDSSALIVYEGCAPTTLRVQRGEDSNPDLDQTIAYRVGSTSVAVSGDDFTAGTGQVTIPAGQNFAEISVSARADGTVEGPESLWLVLDIPCACYTDSIELVITEPEPLVVGLDEAYFCPDQNVRLQPAVTGGVPPLRYNWSFGSTETSPELTPPLPNSIRLDVTDACGQNVTRTIPTFSSAPPELTLPPQDLTACRNEPQSITLDLVGNGNIEVTYQLNNGPIETQSFAGAGRRTWPITRGGNYRIISVQDGACRTPVNEVIRADFYEPTINPRLTNPSCADTEDGRIEVTHLPTEGPYTYSWTGVSPDSLLATDLAAGTYSLRVTDGLGCFDERELELRAPDPLMGVAINCLEIRRPPLRLTAAGGRPPYEYSINGQDYWPAEDFDRLQDGAYYRLRIRDAAGCEFEQPDFFYPRASPRSARLPTFIPQEVAGSVEVVPDYLVPTDQIAAYRWHPAEYFDCASCPQPVLAAPRSQPISLAIDDIYGCTDSLVTFVAVDGRVPLYVPTAFSPNGDGKNDFVSVFANDQQVATILSFQVFSRWGQLLWEDYNFLPNITQRGWDGFLNGQRAPVSAYVWVATYELTTGERQEASGTVVLMAD
ncbi:choice-of-anchor L domain-containing protein [Lewinella sp. W8]|uniref:choice-of-anchor L domain-containing protein n=1 Tax=Lewinella sp. W8 TaxID=2528208 RepID=UPI001067C93A|nr:choice-of-anchor L domain-containing protein [Lewinella sp. W8]MTB50592.1 T9SS type B sorting domain-containing protein [Lewinella sp. W8]